MLRNLSRFTALINGRARIQSRALQFPSVPCFLWSLKFARETSLLVVPRSHPKLVPITQDNSLFFPLLFNFPLECNSLWNIALYMYFVHCCILILKRRPGPYLELSHCLSQMNEGAHTGNLLCATYNVGSFLIVSMNNAEDINKWVRTRLVRSLANVMWLEMSWSHKL